MPFLSSTTDEDEQLARQLSERVTLLMRQDPQFAALVHQNTRRSGGPIGLLGVNNDAAIKAYLAQRGIEIPEGFGFRNMSRPDGDPSQAIGWVTPRESMPGAVKLGMGAVGAAAGGALLGPMLGGGAASSGATSGLSLPGGIPASAGGAGLGGAPAGGLLGALGKMGGMADKFGGVSEVLGAAGASAGAGRRSDAYMQGNLAALNNRAALDAAEFNRDTPMIRSQQVARGDLMAADLKNAVATGGGRDLRFTGGLGPESFGPATKQAGESLVKEALLARMTGSDRLTPQTASLPRAGVMETVGGVAGPVGGILGALGKLRR